MSPKILRMLSTNFERFCDLSVHKNEERDYYFKCFIELVVENYDFEVGNLLVSFNKRIKAGEDCDLQKNDFNLCLFYCSFV